MSSGRLAGTGYLAAVSVPGRRRRSECSMSCPGFDGDFRNQDLRSWRKEVAGHMA